jgi:citronellol/citronellal dehydrogenase
MKMCRTVDIMADAAHVILTKRARDFTGNFCIDDTLLWEAGVRDFDKYRVDPTKDLMPDFFVPDWSKPPVSLKAIA